MELQPLDRIPYNVKGVTFWVTKKTFEMLKSGEARFSQDASGRIIGVVRDLSGRIIEHAPIPPIDSLTSGGPVLVGANILATIGKIAQEEIHYRKIKNMLLSLQTMMASNIAISTANLVATVGIFFYMKSKFKNIERSLREIKKDIEGMHQTLRELQLFNLATITAKIKTIKLFIEPSKIGELHRLHLNIELEGVFHLSEDMLFEMLNGIMRKEITINQLKHWYILWREINILKIKLNIFEQNDNEAINLLNGQIKKLHDIYDQLYQYYMTKTNINKREFKEFLNRIKIDIAQLAFVKRSLYIFKIVSPDNSILENQIYFAAQYVISVNEPPDSLPLVALDVPQNLLNLPFEEPQFNIPELFNESEFE